MATNQQRGTRAEALSSTQASGSDAAPLRVKLTVDPGKGTCPVAEDRRSGNVGDVQLVGERCHIVFEDETNGQDADLRRSHIEESCPCHAVCDAGLSPINIAVADGSLRVDAIVESRDQLNSLSASLEAVDAKWSLRKLQQFTTDDNGHETDGIAVPGTLSVTEKQREAVRTAVERGYYETPRKTSLGELAEEFDVSRSALSQRLIAVEAKLVKGLATNL